MVLGQGLTLMDCERSHQRSKSKYKYTKREKIQRDTWECNDTCLAANGASNVTFPALSLSLSPYVICQFRLLNYICSFFDQQYFFHNVYLLRSNTYMSPLGKVYVLNPFLTISTKNFLFTIDKFRPTQPHPSSLSLHTHLHAKCLTITPSLYGHTFFSTYTNTPYQALISCLFLSNEQLFFSLSLKSTLSHCPSLSLSLSLSRTHRHIFSFSHSLFLY